MITIEEINGAKYTVIWHNKKVSEQTSRKWHKRRGQGQKPTQRELDEVWNRIAQGFALTNHKSVYIATALPALPRNPTDEDASLLYTYASHGLFAVGNITMPDYEAMPRYDNVLLAINFGELGVFGYEGVESFKEFTITHATDKKGNRLEVAIDD